MRRTLYKFLMISVLLGHGLSAVAQPIDANLVRNINLSGEANPVLLTNVNGTLFFRADDGVAGEELWKSDGTFAGTTLVDNIGLLETGSEPRELTAVDGVLYFAANTNLLFGPGEELWKSDGTEAGTVMVRNIATVANASSSPQSLTNVNGTLFFSADDGFNGRELWMSDGTEAGTVLVKDILSGANSSNPSQLTNVNGILFFSAIDDTNGRELWKSDGTAAGTVLVKNIRPGANESNPFDLINVNGTLFFTAFNVTNGTELWKSDGTEAGTVLVKDIIPGLVSSGPFQLTNINGTLFFTAFDVTNGRELWMSDGTEAGTVLVKDILSGANNSNPSQLTNVNGTLFFTAKNDSNGNELWISDGTGGGTVLVRDILSGASGSVPQNLTNVNGTLFFRANDGTNGRELWSSDGSAVGTVLVKDIHPGSDEPIPFDLTNVNGTLFFTADDGVNDNELWKTTPVLFNFNDVPPGSFGFQFIEDFFGAGITGGCSAGNYCPNDSVTRAQMAVFLEKAARGATFIPPNASGFFNDVPVSDPFAPWIEQLAQDGITGGCGGGNYCPNDPVTRAQMAVFIEKALKGADFIPPTATGVFGDVPLNSGFAPWIEQLANDNITGGCGGGDYCPDNPVTRAQMAIFMVKAFNLGFVP